MLPAETTTTILLNHRISTAASIGLVWYDSAILLLSDRLTTLMLYRSRLSLIHCKPLTTFEALAAPSSSLTLTLIRLTLGATPMYAPLRCAPLPPTMPAI